MKSKVFRYCLGIYVLISLSLLQSAAGPRPQGLTEVTLSDARFDGLTRIVVNTNGTLTGIDAAISSSPGRTAR